jgi:hypothetical protein
MTTSNTAGRGLAIAAGVVLATGTLAILFEDVLMHGAQFTLKHWLTLVTVSGTMMVGHLADLARRHRHWMSVAGFSALFLAGTGLVVYSSVGRQAEKTIVSGAQHDELVKQRLDLDGQLVDERAAVKSKREAADKECASGEGSKCRAARATVAFYENSVKGLEARLQVLEPAKPVSAEAEQFANVAAALGYDKDQVRALAILLAPFFTTLFLEFGTIVSFGFAFSPKRLAKIEPSKAQAADPSVTDAQIAKLREAFMSEPSEPSNRSHGEGGATVVQMPKRPKPSAPSNSPNRQMTHSEIQSDLMLRAATGRSFESQKEAADHYGYSESRFSELSKAWEAEGLIPARRMVGRSKQLTKA